MDEFSPWLRLSQLARDMGEYTPESGALSEMDLARAFNAMPEASMAPAPAQPIMVPFNPNPSVRFNLANNSRASAIPKYNPPRRRK